MMHLLVFFSTLLSLISAIEFHIALTQPNKQLVRQMVDNISTPGHPDYGKHFERDELKALLRPEPQANDAVVQWLQESGISDSKIFDDGDWIRFSAGSERAEAIFGASFSRGAKRAPIQRYSPPEKVARYVDMIHPATEQYGRWRGSNKSRTNTTSLNRRAGSISPKCNSTITPSCLRTLYNLPEPHEDTQVHGFIGIAGFLEQYPRYNDLALFAKKYAPYLVGRNFTWESINGEPLNQTYTGDSTEANLDVQYALALGHPLPIKYYATGGRGEFSLNARDKRTEPWLDLLVYLLSLPDGSLPHTLTISYGEPEFDIPEMYSRVVCDLFMQLGGRGVTVLIASGDSGPGKICQAQDGKARFVADFPSSCPYVTSIGGTADVDPERAAMDSSGGFSEVFSRPDYQNKAIGAYLDNLGNRSLGLYNSTGRGTPDIAAQFYTYRIFDKSKDTWTSGTSASAPSVAGIVGLVNSKLIGAGKSPLGFMNPFLYNVGYKAFQDVVAGRSLGCSDMNQGWNATTGWDPVTGFGTPDYERLLAIAMQL